jgi:hypothetical protein
MTPSVRVQFSDRWLPPWPFPLTPTNHTHPPATIWWRTPEFAAEAPASGAGLGKIGHRFRHRFSAPSTSGICRQSTRNGTLQVHRARVGGRLWSRCGKLASQRNPPTPSHPRTPMRSEAYLQTDVYPSLTSSSGAQNPLQCVARVPIAINR